MNPTIRVVAEKIAERLFWNGRGIEAERLVQWRDSDRRNLGGWCKGAVIDQIENVLNESALYSDTTLSEAIKVMKEKLATDGDMPLPNRLKNNHSGGAKNTETSEEESLPVVPPINQRCDDDFPVTPGWWWDSFGERVELAMSSCKQKCIAKYDGWNPTVEPDGKVTGQIFHLVRRVRREEMEGV